MRIEGWSLWVAWREEVRGAVEVFVTRKKSHGDGSLEAERGVTSGDVDGPQETNLAIGNESFIIAN